ncbi:MAG: hypothetical protein R3F33_04950 [Planctomycetota bacterium]
MWLQSLILCLAPSPAPAFLAVQVLPLEQSWHVPGTPPPAPRRDGDVPPVIKDKPLPPV